jgi:SAM-dependent methyltransferase
MPTIEPFEEHTDRYDRWFEAHPEAYQSELAAIERTMPDVHPEDAVEIGVGSGLFAAALDIGLGVDPSPAMLARARDRGITPVRGVAEHLPLAADSVEFALLVTTICFVDDVDRTLTEAARVLKPGATLAIGFVDRESPLGERYLEKQASNPFYRDATFLSVREVLDALERSDFGISTVVQTLFADPEDLVEPDPIEDGWGDGSFVVVAARPPG